MLGAQARPEPPGQSLPGHALPGSLHAGAGGSTAAPSGRPYLHLAVTGRAPVPHQFRGPCPAQQMVTSPRLPSVPTVGYVGHSQCQGTASALGQWWVGRETQSRSPQGERRHCPSVHWTTPDGSLTSHSPQAQPHSLPAGLPESSWARLMEFGGFGNGQADPKIHVQCHTKVPQHHQEHR